MEYRMLIVTLNFVSSAGLWLRDVTVRGVQHQNERFDTNPNEQKST
jgi:hypothetical protein